MTDWVTSKFKSTTFEQFADAQLLDFPAEVREQVRATLIAAMELAYQRGANEAEELRKILENR